MGRDEPVSDQSSQLPESNPIDFSTGTPSPNDPSVQPTVPPSTPNSAVNSVPQPQVAGSVMGSMSAPQPPKKSKTKKIILIAIICMMVILSGVGVGAFLYLNYLNNKPEKVLADALANTTADVLERKPIASVSKIVIKSAENDMEVTIDLDAKSTSNNSEVVAKVDFNSQGIKINTTANIRYIDEGEYYFKIDNLRESISSTVQQLAARQGGMSPSQINQILRTINPLITKIDGTWIQISTDDIDGMASTGASIDECSKALQSLRLSSDDQESLKQLFQENQFITATEEYDKQAVDGNSSFHYLIDFNEDATMQFAKGAVKLPSFKTVVEACDIKEEDIKKPESSSSTSGSDSEEVKVELWVSTDTRRITKLQINAKEAETVLDFNSTLNFDTGDIKVEKPQDFITIKELQQDVQQLIQDISGGSTTSSSSTLSL